MKIVASLLATALLLSASEIEFSDKLSLDEAIEILKSDNLEIQAAALEIDAAHAQKDSVSGMHWGKLDLVQDVANSNDAGNVFGFKLTSREATFNDFGFDEFIANMDTITPGSPTFDGGKSLLATKPDNLNYPDAHTFFQTKLKYEVPLFTGFQISSYSSIMESMTKLKTLEHSKMVNEKVYQVRKSFYDMGLLEEAITHLNTILENIATLENMTQQMIEVGYAKKVDLLEVQAKKGNVERLVAQMQSNEKLLYHYISFLLNQNVSQIQTPSGQVPMPEYSDEQILANNIDIQRAQVGLEVRESMVDVSESSYYPMVGAFAELATADDTFLGDADDHKAYTVGARLTWNIFNGGIDSAKVEQAQLEKLKTQTQVQLANKGIALQIAKIRTEIESYDNEIESLQKELALANEIYKNYEGRYREKLSSMSDVIIKQSEQIQKILQLQETNNKRNKRIFALEKLANGEQ